jgi:hypothetical protein
MPSSARYVRCGESPLLLRHQAAFWFVGSFRSLRTSAVGTFGPDEDMRSTPTANVDKHRCSRSSQDAPLS